MTPVSSSPPIRIDEVKGDAGRAFRSRVVAHNVAGIPSCTVGAGSDAGGGLPVGIQIAAARGRDEAVLAAVAAFDEATAQIQRRWPEP